MVQMSFKLIMLLEESIKMMKKKTVTTNFCYPEVVSNHFKFRHAVDDHNAKRHAPISLEYVCATK